MKIAPTVQMALEEINLLRGLEGCYIEGLALSRVEGRRPEPVEGVYVNHDPTAPGEVAAFKFSGGRVLHVERSGEELLFRLDRSNGYAWQRIRPALGPLRSINVRVLTGANQPTLWAVSFGAGRLEYILHVGAGEPFTVSGSFTSPGGGPLTTRR